jgi:hypothetical protein
MKRTLFFAFLASVFATGLAGCEQQKGPAEKAGAAIDDAIGKAGEKLEEAGKEIKKETGN